MLWKTITVGALLAALAAAGVATASRDAAVATAAKCKAGKVIPTTTNKSAQAAVALGWTAAFRSPGKGVITRFPPRNVNGAPTVFGVLARKVDKRCHATWYYAQLPMRPNDTKGWIRAKMVLIGTVRTKIIVDLSAHSVTLYRNGKRAFKAPAALGVDGTPTPTGHYYVSQRLISPNPGGPYGPLALGLSAYSRVLTNWPQGGPIGIHGTNEPGLIGRNVSHGCIRVTNPSIRTLFHAVLAGTPVTIQH